MIAFKIKPPKTALFDLSKAQKMFKKDIKAFLSDVIPTLQTSIRNEAPHGNTGNLKNTIGTSIKDLIGSVFTGTNYAVVVEKGRAPGKRNPPAAALMSWLRLSTAGRAYMSAMRQKIKNLTYQTAAFILSRSIGKKGIKPNPFFTRGIDKRKQYVAQKGSVLLDTIIKGLN